MVDQAAHVERVELELLTNSCELWKRKEEGGREGGREGRREGGKERGREGGREGERKRGWEVLK